MSYFKFLSPMNVLQVAPASPDLLGEVVPLAALVVLVAMVVEVKVGFSPLIWFLNWSFITLSYRQKFYGSKYFTEVF